MATEHVYPATQADGGAMMVASISLLLGILFLLFVFAAKDASRGGADGDVRIAPPDVTIETPAGADGY